jgi:ADP-ribose pyrophosphatase
MKYISIKKVLGGRFIHRYDITYETEEGREKIYEMISRNPEVKQLKDLQRKKADAVVLIMHDESGEKLLLNREFRLAPGEWVYNFPAGLIEAGETPEESAGRELKEETGLKLLSIKEILPISYSAVGFSNETNLCILGTAAGRIQKSDSPAEEIEAGWYTKKEVRLLLQKELFAGRTQAYSYLWSKQ